MPGHARPAQRSCVDAAPATCADDRLTRPGEVRAGVRGGSGAAYTRLTGVEGELHGSLTHDGA